MRQPQGPGQHHVGDAAVILNRNVRDTLALGEAGIVDEDVDAATAHGPRQHAIDRGLAGIGLADVAHDPDGIRAVGGEIGGRRLYFRFIEIQQCDTGAVRGEQLCGCLADAALASGARDHGDAPLEQRRDAMS